jgi:hypothetical protein
MADSQYALVSSPLCGRLTKCCFLFKSFGLECVVLSLWGALSDERPGLSFVSHSLVICLCVHLLYTFLSFTQLPYTYIYTIQYIWYIQGLFYSRLGTADYALLLTSNWRHNVSLDTWTVVNMTVVKFKPLVFPTSLRSRSYFTTDSQSVSMSWYRVPFWDLWLDITSCRNVAVWNLRSCICWAPSLTRGRVCNLQCNHSIVRVAQNAKPYFTVSSESPPTWRARFPYLYPPGTGWPSYTPGHWVPFTSSFTTLRATVEVL